MRQLHISDDAGEPRPAPDGARAVAFPVFDTDVRLCVYPPDGASAEDAAVRSRLDGALAACRDRCLFFERALSRTRPGSDISRAHAAAPRPVPVAPETAELVRLALGYCARSRGLFDITMGTVTRLWDFRARTVPSRLALARVLPHVGFDRVRVGEAADGTPMLALDDPETVLDLGGVAKGYAADDLARLMGERGVGRFALNLGGNVVVAGGRPGGGPWRVGVADPFRPGRVCALVELHAGSVVTSGSHERRFSRGGTVYHHILSPVDGMPARTDAASATLVSTRSLDGDGYSTTVFMLGVDEGLAFAEGLPGVEALIVDARGRVHETSGLTECVRLIGCQRGIS